MNGTNVVEETDTDLARLADYLAVIEGLAGIARQKVARIEEMLAELDRRMEDEL
jgi:hypothetical protein